MRQSLPAASPQAVVVLGMHRSGTSALTHAIAELGYALPKDVMQGQPDNPRGFFEPRSVASLNDAILADLGGAWDNPGPFVLRRKGLWDSVKRIDAHLIDHYLARARRTLERIYPPEAPIVLKDPRTALTAPLWKAALEAQGYRPSFIHIHRDPREVAASLHARNQISLTQGVRLWQTYVMSILNVSTTTELAATIAYEDLLAQPAEMLKLLSMALGRPVGDEVATAAAAVLAPEDRHQIGSSVGGFLPPLVGDTADLLKRWPTYGPDKRAAAVKRLKTRFEDATLYSGPMIRMAPNTVGQTSNIAPAAGPRPPLLFHYHLFKNAGSSVDAMLKHNFGKRWAHGEFLDPIGGRGSNVEAVEARLRELPDIDAYSSHTALLPPPILANRAVIPILFVRHPVVRLWSAYNFEKSQTVDTFGARVARSSDFAGYIKTLLTTPGYFSARNFQTRRLAGGKRGGIDEVLDKAMKTLDSLPFVGLVEQYDRSLETLHTLVSPHYPDFAPLAVRKNASKTASLPLDEQLATIAQALGAELYEDLKEANAADFTLHARVTADYEARDQ